MADRNLFEIATKEKYRYPYKGLATTEDLWDVSISGLDSIYKTLKAEARARSEESLLSKKTKEEDETLNKIAIVQYIFAEKMAEKVRAEKAAENRKQKQRILEIINEKQDASLKDKSIDELKDMINTLEDDDR